MREARCSSRRVTVSTLAAFLVLAAIGLPAVARAQADTTTGAPATSAIDAQATAARSAASPSSAVSSAAAHGVFGRIRASYLGQMYAKGGVCMHLLLLCAVLGVVIIIERMWTLWRARIDTRNLMMDVVRALRQEGPRGALRECERRRGPIAAILHAGLMRAHRGPDAVEKAIHAAGSIEMGFLERGLLALATISNVAPLLGFLGTVTGIMKAFAAITAAEQVNARIVARGIEEALITTAAGLMIAVPVSAFHAYFVLAIDRFVLEMEGASSELVDELLDIEFRKTMGPAPAPVIKP